MRHGRAKAARKTLQYFGRTIGLKAPYSILLDATFVAAMFQQKILPVKPRLDRILQTSTPSTTPPPSANQNNHQHHHSTTSLSSFNKYFITQSALDELKEIQEGLQAKKHDKAEAFREALEWVRKECIVLKSNDHHRGSTITSKEGKEDDDDREEQEKESKQMASLSTMAQKELLHRIQENEAPPYIVASQDEELLHILRQMGTVPIVRLANNTVLLLEHPSKQSQNQAKGKERHKWNHSLPEAEKALVDLVRKEKRAAVAVQSSQEENPSRQQQQHRQVVSRQKVKKAKGPNPLSCKRKQGSDGNNSGTTKESSSKKRRKRAQKGQESSAGE